MASLIRSSDVLVNDSPTPGSVIAGKYRVETVIRSTEMSVVLAARHLRLDERVVIKLVPPHKRLSGDVMERFLREARAASRLTTEHVVRILDVDTLPTGVPYMVMEYLKGHDLDVVLQTEGPLLVSRAVDLVMQACEAIAEAHSLGIVHRDLKPSNLFLTHRADGTPLVKVLDFGISLVQPSFGDASPRITTTQTIMGTPCYMSPEQLKSTRDVDERTDIWALGAVLHELLIGSSPFEAETVPAICANVLKERPASARDLRSDVPGGLAEVILRCLEKDRSRRFDGVAALAVALAPFGSESAVESKATILRLLRVSGRFAPPDETLSEIRRVPSKPYPLRRLAAIAALVGPSAVGWMAYAHDLSFGRAISETSLEQADRRANTPSTKIETYAPEAPITQRNELPQDTEPAGSEASIINAAVAPPSPAATGLASARHKTRAPRTIASVDGLALFEDRK